MSPSLFLKILFVWIAFLGIGMTVAEANTIRMVYIEAPPFYFTDKDGRPQGILIELMNQVAKKAGYELEAFSYPAKRMAHKLIDGEADIWLGVATIPDFEGKTLIGNTELINVVLNVYYIGNKKVLLDKKDFSGKSMIVLRGYSYGGLINYIKDTANRVTYYETGSHASAFKMLKNGRADYLLDYSIPADRTMRIVKISGLKSARLSSVPLKFVVSRKTPDAPNVLKNIENAYKALLQTGEIRHH